MSDEQGKQDGVRAGTMPLRARSLARLKPDSG
jgi:hypothetical protein